MSKLYDGSDEPLTYGQALVLIAQQIAWPSEAHKAEVVRAVQTEHDLVPAEITPVYQDARDQTINAMEAELAELRAEKARRAQAEKDAADRAELEALRAEKDAYEAAQLQTQ